MKNVVFLLMFFTVNLFAQEVDYNKIIYPENATNISFEEKLVRLAWKNFPSNSIARQQVLISKNEINIARSNWFNLLVFSFNVNQFTINPGLLEGLNYYPKYNLALRVPLGRFMSIPKTIKNSKMEYEISQENVNERKLALRAEVLTRYQVYLKAKALRELQTITLESKENTFSVIEQKFINDEVTLEEYNTSSTQLNNEKVKKINLESAYTIAKINIEALIGVPLEDVK